MTYALIDLAFLAAALVLAAVLRRRPTRSDGSHGRRRRVAWVPWVAAGAALVALTAAFDNVMIAAGLFGYAKEALVGPAVGLVPLEDFAYPLAAIVLLPSLWHRFARPTVEPSGRPSAAAPTAATSKEHP